MENNKKTTPTAIEVSKQEDDRIVSQESTLVNDYDIDGFLEKRKEFITKVNAIMVKGSDYHEIQGKKSLAKGGAEKIASIFGWTARFNKDQDIAEAFGKVEGLISFVCSLQKSGMDVGEGRGAAILSKNAGDPNKTIKMAQKSAFIDAVLRASGLSDFFTQDLEDMPREQISQPTQTASKSTQTGPRATIKQQGFILKLAEQKGVMDKITPQMVDKLDMMGAKKWIDKLKTMPDKKAEPVDYNKPPFEDAQIVEKDDHEM